MSRIFITGDTHGSIDIHKLNKKNFPQGKELTKDDYVIICGDFGFVWGGISSREDKWWQNWLNMQPWTTLFVDGNHENFDLLNSYSVEEWNGGRIHKINESIFHLMRGEIFNIGEYTFFAFGGGFSHDIYRRKEGISWWQNEMPIQEEIDNALNNLTKHHNQVDFILTHEAPQELQGLLGYCRENMTPYDTKYQNLSKFLQYLKENVEYREWFLGHYHIDRHIESYHIMYDDVIELEGIL